MTADPSRPTYLDTSGDLKRRDRWRKCLSENPEAVMGATLAFALVVVGILFLIDPDDVDGWLFAGTLFTSWALFLALLIWWATALDVANLSVQLSRLEANMSDQAAAQEQRAQSHWVRAEEAASAAGALRDADGNVRADAIAGVLEFVATKGLPVDDPASLPAESEDSPAIETTARAVDQHIVDALRTTTGVSREHIAKGVWFEGSGNRPWYIRTTDGRRYIVALDKTKRAKTIQRLRNEEPDPPFAA